MCWSLPLESLCQAWKIPVTNPSPSCCWYCDKQCKVFTVFDAVKGYHQCPLDEQSQLLTTFITPFGRFKYLRAPYGISSISEHYDRRMAEAFAGLTRFCRIVDDIVIYDSDITQHVNHVKEFLQRCSEKKISLNLNKCKFFQTQVTFAGFIVCRRLSGGSVHHRCNYWIPYTY